MASRIWVRRHMLIAVVSLFCLGGYGLARLWLGQEQEVARGWLMVALVAGGIPLVGELLVRLAGGRLGSDLLAGMSIVASVLLGEHLAGVFVVLMLSGGAAIESMAVRRASSALDALARRMPSKARRKTGGALVDIPLGEIQIGDVLVVLPHEICPVDGVVIAGRGGMDEAYLTGEPYRVSKAIGSQVISGAMNGDSALEIRAVRLPVDSRYAMIMRVMRESQQHRPRLRRLGDQLGAFSTPLATAVACLAWLATGDPIRFLAVLVIATPCPLLIAIPVAIVATISLAARRSIIIRDPSALERIGHCRTMIFDKTGTLTYGEARLVDQHVDPAFDQSQVLRLAASLEQYSKHPLATAVLEAAQASQLVLEPAERVEEHPGLGLAGLVAGRSVRITSARLLLIEQPDAQSRIPPSRSGLECVIAIDGRYAATYRFRDEPRTEGANLIGHLRSHHGFEKIMIVSGDRPSEVEYLAQRVGIGVIHSAKSPEEKLAIVRAETSLRPTVYVGDGVNDAPAMAAATVGLALGERNAVTTEAAGAVILDRKLSRVDELLHMAIRMRRIALQSAVGGMTLSALGMVLAAFGQLTPIAGAIGQEIIDLAAVLWALRAAWPPAIMTDFLPIPPRQQN